MGDILNQATTAHSKRHIHQRPEPRHKSQQQHEHHRQARGRPPHHRALPQRHPGRVLPASLQDHRRLPRPRAHLNRPLRSPPVLFRHRARHAPLLPGMADIPAEARRPLVHRARQRGSPALPCQQGSHCARGQRG